MSLLLHIGFSARIKAWSSASDNLAGVGLRRYPPLLFANAVNVGDHVGGGTFRLVEEGRAVEQNFVGGCQSRFSKMMMIL